MNSPISKRMTYVFYDLLVNASKNKNTHWPLYREKEAIAVHLACTCQDMFFEKGHISRG